MVFVANNNNFCKYLRPADVPVGLNTLSHGKADGDVGGTGVPQNAMIHHAFERRTGLSSDT